jgi:hypothetical protein
MALPSNPVDRSPNRLHALLKPWPLSTAPPHTVPTASVAPHPRCLRRAPSTSPPLSPRPHFHRPPRSLHHPDPLSSPTQSPEVPRHKGLRRSRASLIGSSSMEMEPTWMEKYRVWREQHIALSTSSKHCWSTMEATILAEELSTAVGRLSLGQGGITGSSQRSNEVSCPACKKNERNLVVRTCVTAVLHEL